MTTVYGAPLSPFVRKVILALESKGVEFSVKIVTPMQKPDDFEKVSPLGKIPAFEDDLLITADSTVICEYLDERYPEQVAIYPKDLVERARARWFEEYADTVGIATTGPVFFERVVKPKLMGEASDEDTVREVINNKLPKMYDYLDSELSDTGFIAGQTISVADFSIGSHLINMMYSGEEIDAVLWPKLAAYKNRLFATELFINRMASDKAMLSV